VPLRGRGRGAPPPRPPQTPPRYATAKNWGGCLEQRWRKKQDVGENYVTRNFMIFPLNFFSVVQDMRLVSVKMKQYTNKCTILQYKVDLLRAGQSRDRIPVGSRFSALVQTGPEAHSASYTVGIGSFQGEKRPHMTLTTHPHLAPRLEKEYTYTSTRPPGLRGLLWGEPYFLPYLQNTKVLQL
jgi:hypothetical protein